MSKPPILIVLGACMIALCTLTFGIRMLTIYIASFSGPHAVLLTLVFPIIAEFIWILVLSGKTGTLFYQLTLLCSLWVILFAIMIVFIAMPEGETRQPKFKG